MPGPNAGRGVRMISRLYRLRLALGLTQAQAARRAGISVPTWRAAEQADPSVGPWLSARATQCLLPGLRVQAWYLEGDYDRGRELCRALAEQRDGDAGNIAYYDGYLLPEVGRSIMIVWPDDLEEWLTVLGSHLDGRELVYDTPHGPIPVSQVLGVRP